MIEFFYEKLYVDQGLPWFLQVKDDKGTLLSEHKASEVIINAPSKAVFLPNNAGGKRGFIRTSGTLRWSGTIALIYPPGVVRVPEVKKDSGQGPPGDSW